MNNTEIPLENMFTTGTAIVDGEQWYSILMDKEAAKWLRIDQKSVKYTQWFETTDPNWTRIRQNYSFDVHEELYLLLKLKFS